MCLAAGVTDDILVCPECGHYHDGYPQGYTRPKHKHCQKCNHPGLVDAKLTELLAKANRDQGCNAYDPDEEDSRVDCEEN